MNSTNKYIYLFGIIVITFIAFFPSLTNGFTNWDDDVYVTQNPIIQSPELYSFAHYFTEVQASNYHPLTMLSLKLDHSVSGNNAAVYHYTNLLFHLLNVALVFLFSFLLSQKKLWVAIITSILFAIHPQHVESVAWISERKDVLYVFFFLWGLLSYLYAKIGKNNTKWLLLTYLFFVLSLLSKPAAVIFPLVLLLIDWYTASEKNTLGVQKVSHESKTTNFSFISSLVTKIPFFVLSIIFGLITFNIQKYEAISISFSFTQKICFAAYGFVMYLVKMILPFHLSPLYPYPVANATQSLPSLYLAMPIVAVAILALTFYVGKKNKAITFGVLFYLVNIILVLQIIAVGNAVMSDRYTYLSSVGIFFMLAMLLNPLFENKQYKNIALGGLAVLTLGFSVLTFQQCKIWKNSETLWTKAIEVDSDNMLAYNKRALALMENPKNAQRALADFDKCIAIAPTYDQGWGNRGYLYFKANQFDKAEADFTKAIALNPNFYKHYNNRGHLYYKQQNFDKALTDYNACISLNNTYALAYNNRAIIYHQQGEKEKALADYEKALSINPNYTSAKKNRALLLNQ